MRKNIVIWFSIILVAIISAFTMTASTQTDGGGYGYLTTRIERIEMPKLLCVYGSAETSISIINDGCNVFYFYNITEGNKKCSFSYAQLNYIVNYLDTLSRNAIVDVANGRDVVNEITTLTDEHSDCGVGYYTSSGKTIRWFLHCADMGERIYPKGKEDFFIALNKAKEKIEQLMLKNGDKYPTTNNKRNINI